MSQAWANLEDDEATRIDEALTRLRLALQTKPGDQLREETSRELRRLGFSVQQIITLSGGEFKKSTVDRHVTGVHAAANAPADRAIAMLGEAVQQNVTVTQIRDILRTLSDLETKHVEYSDIILLLGELRDSSVEIADFVKDYKTMKTSGLTPADLKRHLEYKQQLETAGFGLQSLGIIAEAAKKYPTPDDVLRAINLYDSIQDLTSRQTDLESKLGELEKNMVDQNDTFTQTSETLRQRQEQLDNLQNQIRLNQNTLNNLQQVQQLGYNQEHLKTLADLTNTYGGTTPFFEAITLFPSLQAVQKRIDDLKTEHTKLQTANIHYEAYAEMSRKLVEKHLGLDTLEALLKLAEKYGPPEQVFRAVQEHTNILQITEELKTLHDKLTLEQEQEKAIRRKLEEIIPELQDKLETLNIAFQDEFNTTKSATQREIKSLLDAAHAVDNTYEERERKAEEVKAWMELLNLATDPASVTNVRILATTQLLLTKLAEWLGINEKRFGFAGAYTSPFFQARDCRNLASNLGRLSGAVKHEPTS